MIKNFKWLLLVLLTFVACSKNDEGSTVVEVPITAGTADFSKYVSLGNSLTAGYSDGALFKKGQEGSYTNILAKQFALVGGGEFKIPYTNDNIGGLLFGGNTNPAFGPRLYFDGAGPVPVSGTPTTEVFAPNTGGPYNNMGVPGAKSFHLLAEGYGNPAGLSIGAANPYFVRFASSAGTSILADALVQNPTFFSLWIGNNDVLSYATSGGIGTNQIGNLNPVTYGSNDITDPNVFGNVYSTLVDKLTEKGAKGVIANIPDVTTIPFFTTVPSNPLKPSVLGAGVISNGDATIDALNAQLYGPLKQALTAFGAGDRISLLVKSSKLIPDPSNPLLIKDEYLTNLSAQLTAALTPSLGAQTAAAFGAIYGQARQATADDYILLSSRSQIGATQPGVPASINKKGITYPFEDKLVLSAGEAGELKIATDAYNATIKALATSKGLAFVDANSVLNTVYKTGIRFGNFQITSTYVTGGAFSLDGVHPSPRGYALIANEFMKAINATYGSTFRPVDLSLYPIQFPGIIN
jgi:lysophospholipase L1-like esterase